MDRSDIHVRPALSGDCLAMAEIHVSTWRTDYRGFAPDDYLDGLSVADVRNVYLSILEGPDSAAFIAEDGSGRPVGLSTCGPYLDEGQVLDGRFSGELYNLYVLTGARKSGAGRNLVRAAARGLLSRGSTSMMLWTLEGYASNTFYPRLGGRVVGRRKAMIGTNEVSDLAFGWDDLGTLIDGET
jgi:GNAT superfamily N-acetyltransferase